MSLLVLRMTTETIAPGHGEISAAVYHVGRFVFGIGGAAVTMAIVLLAFHAAPVHKKIFFSIDHKSKPPFGLGLDHLWLSFFQYETGAVFSNLGRGGSRSVSHLRTRRAGERVRSQGRVAAAAL